MPDSDQIANLNIGLTPDLLECSLELEDTAHELNIKNSSLHSFGLIKLTVSYYDSEDVYLDFEDIELDEIPGHQSRNIPLAFAQPDRATTATIDVTGVEQTFLKRHWKLISTVAVVIWGIVILTRRLAP